MATVINMGRSALGCEREALPLILRRRLPYELVDAIEATARSLRLDERIEEIRLRGGGTVCLTVGGHAGRRNVSVGVRTTENELSEMIAGLCDGSLYAYGESMTRGYVALEGGIRVGVCGRAASEGGRILGVYGISALNIRLPCRLVPINAALARRISSAAREGDGTLIYSPPGGGKTTFLRSLLPYLADAGESMRVAVVDTGDELMGTPELAGLSVDVLSGYPKAEGIRIATSYMNPQVIVCDEISNDEAEAVSGAQNCGVALIASAHGADAASLLKRSGMRTLYEVGAFSLYVRLGISRDGFSHRVHRREEIAFAYGGNDSRSD